jgi:hypothetical protein
MLREFAAQTYTLLMHIPSQAAHSPTTGAPLHPAALAPAYPLANISTSSLPITFSLDAWQTSHDRILLLSVHYLPE